MPPSNQTCRQNQDHVFEISANDLAFYEHMQVPPPTLCPDCRLQRRLAFRHGGKLYNRKCDLSGKETISMYAQEVPFPVYEQTEWWSDKWDGLSYGRDVDLTKPFFPQLKALTLEVPHISLVNINCENSYYTNQAINQKDCYLVFGATNNENTMYGYFVQSCQSVVDALSLVSCELCYEGIASIGCYHCRYVYNSKNCSDSTMIEDCQNCKNCIGCFGLRNQEYCVFNQRVGKEKYEQMKKDLEPFDHQKLLALSEKFYALKMKQPHLAARIYNSENCTGDMVFNSKNCQCAFDCKESEDSKFIYFTPKAIHSYDCTFNAPDGVEFCYEVGSTVGVRDSMFTYLFWYGSNSYYSIECHNSHNLFGCVGLKRKQYCILNKQYTKEEYEKIVPQLIAHMKKTGEWGEYFPMSMSHFAYNESLAQSYFPLSQEQVKAHGLAWKEDKKDSQYFGPTVAMPATIEETSDDICKQVLTCEECHKHYKVVIQELRLYRQMAVPVPRFCFDCRYHHRLALSNPKRLWQRNCMKCQAPIQTSYAPERKEIVYCEKCYLEEVY